MPKGTKTRKTALQRFKITATGKLLRKHSRTSHLRSKESTNTRNRKKGTTGVAPEFQKTVRKMIGG